MKRPKLDRYPTPDELLSGRVGIATPYDPDREPSDREEDEALDFLLDPERG